MKTRNLMVVVIFCISFTQFSFAQDQKDSEYLTMVVFQATMGTNIIVISRPDGTSESIPLNGFSLKEDKLKESEKTILEQLNRLKNEGYRIIAMSSWADGTASQKYIFEKAE